MMLKLMLTLTLILMWTTNGCDEVVVLEEAGNDVEVDVDVDVDIDVDN